MDGTYLCRKLTLTVVISTTGLNYSIGHDLKCYHYIHRKNLKNHPYFRYTLMEFLMAAVWWQIHALFHQQSVHTCRPHMAILDDAIYWWLYFPDDWCLPCSYDQPLLCLTFQILYLNYCLIFGHTPLFRDCRILQDCLSLSMHWIYLFT